MRFILILVLGVTAFTVNAAKKTSKADVEDFVRAYVKGVVKEDLNAIAIDEAFKSALEDDSLDFAECRSASCKTVLRSPIKMREYDEEDEEAPEDEIFEVHMDVFKSGKILARRSGCYMIMKKDGRFVMHEYLYDCSE